MLGLAPAPGSASADSPEARAEFPAFECIAGLRSARIADASGKHEVALQGYTSSLTRCGRDPAALVELIAFLDRRGLEPTIHATSVAELSRRLVDPTFDVPDEVLERIAGAERVAPELFEAAERRCALLLDQDGGAARLDNTRQRRIWRVRGWLAERRGDLETALVAAKQSHALGEEDYAVTFAWHRLGRELGRWDEALAGWRAMLGPPGESQEHKPDWYEIELLGKAGLVDEQLAALRPRFSEPPKAEEQNWELTTGLAAAFALRDAARDDEAATMLRLLVERHPHRDEPRRALVHLYADSAEAKMLLGEALRHWSSSSDVAEVVRGFGELILAGSTEEADRLIERLRELAPDRAGVWHEVRNAAVNARAFELAVGPAKQYAELSPELAEAHYSLGHILLALDRCGEALGPFRRALALGEPHARNAVNHCLHKLGRPRE